MTKIRMKIKYREMIYIYIGKGIIHFVKMSLFFVKKHIDIILVEYKFPLFMKNIG